MGGSGNRARNVLIVQPECQFETVPGFPLGQSPAAGVGFLRIVRSAGHVTVASRASTVTNLSLAEGMTSVTEVLIRFSGREPRATIGANV